MKDNKMMTFEEQVLLITKTSEDKNFCKVIFPYIIKSDYDEIDKTDFLAVLKDMDIHKYTIMDTAAREYLIDICKELASK